MSNAFVRQIGAESGVQLNSLQDNSQIPSGDTSDRGFAIMMRATRGRIDKPFVVDRGNVKKKLGPGEPIRLNDLNEAWVCVVEALDKGANQAVIQRLVTSAATIKWLVIAADSSSTSSDPGTPVDPEAPENPSSSDAPSGFTYMVMDDSEFTEFTDPYLLAIRHLECHNDGIMVEFRAESKKVGGVEVDVDKLTLRILDKGQNLLHEFNGSLNSESKNDYGISDYISDVAQSQTDTVDLRTGVKGSNAVISATSLAYGYDANGRQKWAKAGPFVCFTEGGTAYTTADYSAARVNLQYTQFGYGYISSGATKSLAMLAQLAQLSYDTNTQMRFDIPGHLTPDEAITFVNQLNMGGSQAPHLIHAFWAPLKSDDPTGVNPIGYFGTATLNIAYACARNAQVNAKGFAPKNFPIAGREWPIQRTRIIQTSNLESRDLNALAQAKINPVVYETYTGGGRYVFRDSLTCAQVESSLKKLIAVAEMSTYLDDVVTRAAKDYLQFPMDLAVKYTAEYIRDFLEGAQTSRWIVPSNEPDMDGKAFVFSVRPNEKKPYEDMDVSFAVRYDGTNRRTLVTQTLRK
jgi:hypothetical protein